MLLFVVVIGKQFKKSVNLGYLVIPTHFFEDSLSNNFFFFSNYPTGALFICKQQHILKCFKESLGSPNLFQMRYLMTVLETQRNLPPGL
jgi:hypothetical protein